MGPVSCLIDPTTPSKSLCRCFPGPRLPSLAPVPTVKLPGPLSAHCAPAFVTGAPTGQLRGLLLKVPASTLPRPAAPCPDPKMLTDTPGRSTGMELCCLRVLGWARQGGHARHNAPTATGAACEGFGFLGQDTARCTPVLFQSLKSSSWEHSCSCSSFPVIL